MNQNVIISFMNREGSGVSESLGLSSSCKPAFNYDGISHWSVPYPEPRFKAAH